MATSDGSPQPGEFWATAKGRTVEIVAREVVADWITGIPVEISTVAYRYLGGSAIHLRSVSSLEGWKKVEFE